MERRQEELNHHDELMEEIRKLNLRLDGNYQDNFNQNQEIRNELKVMNLKINPMYDIFTSVSGWNKISIWILKFLAMIGVAVGVLWTFFKWIRN